MRKGFFIVLESLKVMIIKREIGVFIIRGVEKSFV